MQETSTGGRRLSNRAIARLVGVGVVLVVFLVFVFQNGRTVSVQFLFWEANVRLAWALILAGVLGLLIVAALPRLRRLL